MNYYHGSHSTRFFCTVTYKIIPVALGSQVPCTFHLIDALEFKTTTNHKTSTSPLVLLCSIFLWDCCCCSHFIDGDVNLYHFRHLNWATLCISNFMMKDTGKKILTFVPLSLQKKKLNFIPFHSLRYTIE